MQKKEFNGAIPNDYSGDIYNEDDSSDIYNKNPVDSKFEQVNENINGPA